MELVAIKDKFKVESCGAETKHLIAHTKKQ